MGTIQFIAGANTITVNRPGYGYGVDVVMPITWQEKHPAGYAEPFDATSTHDYRILRGSTLMLPADQKYALNEFFRSAAVGRCETVTLRLGASPTGFFPGGPDLGDVGDFTLRLLSQKQGGALLSPFRYFRDELSFILVSAPSYALPTQVSQGSFQIGTVDGLLFPQNLFDPEKTDNWRTDVSLDGTPHSVDGNTSHDSWESTWDQQLNHSKAVALVSYLTGASGRGSDIDIIAGLYYYMFGMDNGSDGSYTSKFLGSSREKNKTIISIRHDRYNHFTIPMTWWMAGKNGVSWQDTDGATEKYQDTDGAELIYQDKDGGY